MVVSLGLVIQVCGQTASTGALMGVLLDPSGAIIRDATIQFVNHKTAEIQNISSNDPFAPARQLRTVGILRAIG